MTKVSLHFKLLIALTLIIGQTFISCQSDNDISNLLPEEIIDQIIEDEDEQEDVIEEEESEEIIEEEEEDSNEDEQEEMIEDGEESMEPITLPVTIDLTTVMLGYDDTFFVVDGFNFTSEEVTSFQGSIFLAPGSVTLDLTEVTDISTISALVTDNNTSITIELFNNGNKISEESFFGLNSYTPATVSVDVQGLEIDAVSIIGGESQLFSITLE